MEDNGQEPREPKSTRVKIFSCPICHAEIYPLIEDECRVCRYLIEKEFYREDLDD